MGKLTVIQHINRLQPRQRFSPKCATCATYTRQGHFYMLTCTFDLPCLCRRGVSPYLDLLLCTTFCDCDWGSCEYHRPSLSNVISSTTRLLHIRSFNNKSRNYLRIYLQFERSDSELQHYSPA
jgi:hypothetical protein